MDKPIRKPLTKGDKNMTKKVTVGIKILNWVTGAVIYESDKETIKEAVVGANLRDANLRDADLHGANLHGANLYGANLYGADLRDANLHGANLYGADLRDANLHGANLYGADLRDANLYGADLRDANLYGADLHGANLYDANLYGADLHGANLRDADLHGANLDNLPKDFINQCSRDILFILGCLKSEVPALRQMLVDGKVDGSQYEGECACLIGSLANADGGMDKVCSAIPFYEKGTHNYGEMWFLNIHKGDTPKTNQFSKHAVMLCDMVVPYKKTKKASNNDGK